MITYVEKKKQHSPQCHLRKTLGWLMIMAKAKDVRSSLANEASLWAVTQQVAAPVTPQSRQSAVTSQHPQVPPPQTSNMAQAADHTQAALTTLPSPGEWASTSVWAEADLSQALQRVQALLAVLRWLTPLSIAVAVIVTLLGVPGNLLVIKVFWKKRKESPANLYVLILAILDCVVCCLFMPMMPVFISRGWATSTWMVWYKLMWTFLMLHNSLYSLYLLDLIALDRQRTICNPLKPKVSHRLAVMLILAGLACSALLAAVAVAVREVGTSNPIIKVFAFPQSVGLIIIVVSYGRIFLFLCRRKKTVGVGLRTQAPHSGAATASSVPSAVTLAVHTEPPTSRWSRQAAGVDCTSTSAMPPQSAAPDGVATKTAIHQKRHLAKTAKTLGLITLIFILTYLPMYVIAPIVNVQPYLLYTYALNYIANPILYFCLNTGFRNEVKAFCKQRSFPCAAPM